MATGLLGFNPYGGGTVLDISSKPSQFAIQHLQHEQAKDEALDNYFRDLDKTVNTAGIRDIDQQAVLQKLAENRDIYFKNRDALKHPEKYGVDLYNQFMNNYRAAQGIINKSKQEYATQKAAQNLITQAKEKGEVVSDDFVKALANNQGRSVEDTGYVPTDLSNFTTHIPHNDLAYSKLLKTVKLNQGKDVTDYRTDRLPDNQTQVTYAKHYPDLNEVTSYSNDALNNQNPKIAKGERIFAQSLLDNPNEVKRLGEIYTKRTGAKMPLTPEGIHLAHSISLAPIQEVKIKEGDTPEYAAAKLAAQEASRKRVASFTHGLGVEGGSEDPIDSYLQQSRSGITFSGDEGKDIEKVNLPSKITDDLKETKDRKAPIIGRGLSTGKYYNIKFQDPKLVGGKTDIIDWTKTTEIPEIQLRGSVTNHVYPSKNKINITQGKGGGSGKKDIKGF